jgi:hypothetical protein
VAPFVRGPCHFVGVLGEPFRHQPPQIGQGHPGREKGVDFDGKVPGTAPRVARKHSSSKEHLDAGRLADFYREPDILFF